MKNKGFDAISVLGMSEAEAIKVVEAAGVTYRVMARDGESFVGTCDWKPNRLNLRIAAGKVVSVDFG